MTVSELIEKLKTCEQDAVVFIQIEDLKFEVIDVYTPVPEITEIEYYKKPQYFDILSLGRLYKTHTIMSDLKSQLEAKRVELDKELNELNDFNASTGADEIDPIQNSLLRVQAGAMYTYLECIKERLARL